MGATIRAKIALDSVHLLDGEEGLVSKFCTQAAREGSIFSQTDCERKGQNDRSSKMHSIRQIK